MKCYVYGEFKYIINRRLGNMLIKVVLIIYLCLKCKSDS